MNEEKEKELNSVNIEKKVQELESTNPGNINIELPKQIDNSDLNSRVEQNIGLKEKDIEETKEDNKRANQLCILSIVSLFLPGILLFLSVLCMSIIKNDVIYNIASLIYIIMELLSSFSPMISIGLLIYVRIKYPKNVFSKVLIVLYVILFIIFLVFAIAAFFACLVDLQNCPW